MLTWFIILVLLISFAGTFIILKVAHRKKILDIPNHRSSHSIPTPRGGGLAIVLSWYLGLLGLRCSGLIEADLFFALLSGSILAVIGLLDDLFSIKPWIRLLFQVCTVIFGLYFLGGFNFLYLDGTGIHYPSLFYPLALIGAVWFINLYNFLDGIDGYASVEAITVVTGMYLISQNPVFLILIFSVMGFLIWNWPKAKIFMGDIGSTQLGYILVVFGIHFNNTHQVNIFGFLILTSLFWIDASLTLFRRWRNCEELSLAHKKHAYQRIVQFGFSHKKTLLISIVINIGFTGFVLLSERNIIPYYVTFPLCFTINYLLVRLIDQKLPFKTEVPI